MFEIFTEGITLLNAISLLAFLTTVALFFCGLGICRQIIKRRDTKEISGAPFIMGVIGGSCWWAYGRLKNDQTVLYVTSIQVVLYLSYLIFYWFMTRKKLMITIKFIATLGICAMLYFMVRCFGMKVYHPLGIICLCLNVADFAAPLANIKYVIRKRSSQTLPLPLCIANFLVSNEWFIYGLLKDDFYLILPNGVGSIFATINLVLFIVLPRKTGLRSPILMLFDIILCRRHSSEDGSVADVEAAAVEVTYKELQDSNDRKTWSDRMIANVTGEFENVIAKCTLKEQFGYSDTLNKKLSTDSSVSHIDTISAGSSSIDAEPAKVCDKNDTSLFPENVAIAFDTKQLQQLCGQLSSILHPNQQRRTTEKRQRRQSEYPTEPIASLHRTTSAPNLSHCGQDDN